MNELLSILQHEVQLHQQLLSLLQNEAEGFGRLSGSELLKLQGVKNQYVRSIARIEKDRIQFVEQLAENWKVDSEDLTLSVIIGRTEELSEPLQECFDQLKNLIADIRKIAEDNAFHSAARLKSVEASIQFMNRIQDRPPTYSEAGKLHNGGNAMSRTAI